MFRKIHSNKDPGATIGTELKKEFGRYFRRAAIHCRRLLGKYPIPFFAGMVISILLSGILAFTIMRVDKPQALPALPRLPASGAGGGMGNMLEAYNALKEAAALQSRIEAIARKDTLDTADSTEVMDALLRIDAIHKQLKLKQNRKP